VQQARKPHRRLAGNHPGGVHARALRRHPPAVEPRRAAGELRGARRRGRRGALHRRGGDARGHRRPFHHAGAVDGRRLRVAGRQAGDEEGARADEGPPRLDRGRASRSRQARV
ncbi:MAG: hypothetical protein AVDCRST_MAG89-5121, partial [uncultured Gemmatimonadetes bacterium]